MVPLLWFTRLWEADLDLYCGSHICGKQTWIHKSKEAPSLSPQCRKQPQSTASHGIPSSHSALSFQTIGD